VNRKISTAATLSALSQVASVAIALWSTPRIVHGLGNAGFALYAALGAFASYFAWLELGLGAAYVRSLTTSLSRQDTAAAQVQVSTAHALYTRIAAVGFVVLLGLGAPYVIAVSENTRFQTDALLSLLVLGLAFAGSMSLSTARAVVFSMQRADLYARAALIVSPLVPLTQVAIVLSAPSMTGVFGVQALANIGMDFYLLFCARALAPELRFVSRFDVETWREWRSFSFAKFGTQVTTQLQYSADRLLLGYLVPLANAAPYSVAASISARVRGVENALCIPYYAAAVEQFASRGRTAVLSFLVRFAAPISTLMMIGLAVTYETTAPFLRIWMGDEFAESGSAPMFFLVASTVAGTHFTLLTQTLEAIGAATTAFKLTVVSFAASFVSALPLSAALGPVGMAIGFLAGPTIGVIASIAVLTRHSAEEARLFVLKVIIGPAILGLLTWLGGRLLSHLLLSAGIFDARENLRAAMTTTVALLPAVILVRQRRASTATDAGSHD